MQKMLVRKSLAPITISKHLIKRAPLVVIPQAEYEELLRLRQKWEWEEKDTKEAVKIYEKERKAKKLREIQSLADID